MEKRYFAAVGDDGIRPVVWGLGSTEQEALDEACGELASSDCASRLIIHEISAAQDAVVRGGDVSWPIERIANAHGFNHAITFMEENDLSLWRGVLSSSIEPDESLVNACTDSMLREILGVAVLRDADGGWTPEAEAALADYNAGYREAIKEALAEKEQS